MPIYTHRYIPIYLDDLRKTFSVNSKSDFRVTRIIRKMGLRQVEQNISSFFATFLAYFRSANDLAKNEERPRSTCIEPFLHGTSKIRNLGYVKRAGPISNNLRHKICNYNIY